MDQGIEYYIFTYKTMHMLEPIYKFSRSLILVYILQSGYQECSMIRKTVFPLYSICSYKFRKYM